MDERPEDPRLAPAREFVRKIYQTENQTMTDAQIELVARRVAESVPPFTKPR